MHPERPRTMGEPAELAARLARVDEPHVAPLNEWVRKQLRPMPWFDPDDAGVNARVMFLLESPGPMSDSGKGSGIISVDNDDPTAENLWTFRRSAGLDGPIAVSWNAVPWYLGQPGANVVAPDLAQMEQGSKKLGRVVQLFPDLEVVVPMGNVAQRVWGMHCARKANKLITVPTRHPSPLGLAAAGARDGVSRSLDKVATLLAL